MSRITEFHGDGCHFLINVKQGTCCHFCHSVNDHLDCVDCCLAKTKEICICEKFHDKKSKLTMPQKQGKIPKKEEHIAELLVKDGKISQNDCGILWSYLKRQSFILTPLIMEHALERPQV